MKQGNSNHHGNNKTFFSKNICKIIPTHSLIPLSLHRDIDKLFRANGSGPLSEEARVRRVTHLLACCPKARGLAVKREGACCSERNLSGVDDTLREKLKCLRLLLVVTLKLPFKQENSQTEDKNIRKRSYLKCKM